MNLTAQDIAAIGIEPERAQAFQRALAGTEKGDRLLEAAVALVTNGDDPWQVRTLADARKPRPPLQNLIPGIALPSLCIPYGAPGTLKSFLFADLCLCVVTGTPWLLPLPGQPGEGMPVTQSPAAWIDFDNGRRRTDERFEALANAYHAPDDAPLYYYSMPSPWLDAGSDSAMGDLADRLISRGVKLAVIDNLGVITGRAEENSADMVNVMSHLRELSERIGGAVVPIHHQRKSNGFTGRSGETLRGHSSIEAALDLALRVEREDRSDIVTVRSTKTRDTDIKPFGAQFTYRLKPGTNELAEARFFGAPVADTDSDAAVEAAIVEAVGANRPVNQSKLKAQVKAQLPDVGVNRICALANRLVARGELKATSGKHGAQQYDIP